jgi:hypothetical protein
MLPATKIPAKSHWPPDDEEVVDEDKSSGRWPSTMRLTKEAQLMLAAGDEVGERKPSKVTLAVGRRGCRRRN